MNYTKEIRILNTIFMYQHLDKNSIEILEIPIAPFKAAINRDVKISDHLTIGELYDATKVLNKSDLLEYGIPIHKNFLKVFELIRKHTKKPLYLGSAYRSYDWEKKKGRTGTSKHIEAIAYDLNGQNLKEVLTTALKEKNQLYKDLRNLGVNAFGLYDWGYHLDFRENKPDNNIYYWVKKKTKLSYEYIGIILFILIYFRKYIITFFKLKI